jgi:hypothetical protein
MSEKKLIERYIDAMQNCDWVALSQCFEVKSRLFDFCPIGYQMANYHVYGREGIEMFFNNKFFFRRILISDPVIQDDSTANYLVAYEGQYLHVQAKIEKLGKEGLIQEMTIRPA